MFIHMTKISLLSSLEITSSAIPCKVLHLRTYNFVEFISSISCERERTFWYLQNLVVTFILIPFTIKSTERDQISRHCWYVFDVLRICNLHYQGAKGHIYSTYTGRKYAGNPLTGRENITYNIHLTPPPPPSNSWWIHNTEFGE
jgi:hypothetical protein